nr:unnamed protein product [Callosobruchus chinensis]
MHRRFCWCTLFNSI